MALKYKVGDRVRIKSLDWYNENKDENGDVEINENFVFYADRSKYCGKVFTISKVFNRCYSVKEDNGDYYWTDGMIEGLVEDDIIDIDEFQDDNEVIDIIDEYVHRLENNECQIDLPESYQFTDEDGNVINATKIVLKKKKKEYPKTYEECCRIIDYHLEGATIIGYKKSLLENFQKLLICRDAYWKIAGAEMGLGKPWKPDWEDESDKFTIGYFYNDIDTDIIRNYESHPLAFPTKEMRDAFYENFKEEIEFCKKLL